MGNYFRGCKGRILTCKKINQSKVIRENFRDIETDAEMGGGFFRMLLWGILYRRQALLHSFREIKIVGGLFQLFCIFDPGNLGKSNELTFLTCQWRVKLL